MDPAELARVVTPHLSRLGVQSDARLEALCALYKDRCDTLLVLADWIKRHYGDVEPSADELRQHLTDAVRPAVAALARTLADVAWEPTAIAAAIKAVLTEHGLKMPQLAMPVRVLVMGTPQTPSVDQVLALQHREVVLERLSKA